MIEALLTLVETRMRAVVAPLYTCDHSVVRAALHHFAAGGSRVRARLCLQVSDKLNLATHDAITLATICELLHNASLIHDDLIDRAPLRRGVPSVWAAFDDATALCAGDLLLASSFGLVGELACDGLLAAVLSLVQRRTREIILGQALELSSAPETLAAYETLAIGKSAALLSLPLELPILLSGNLQHLDGAYRSASTFAVAYQMLDDLDDYEEDRRNGALNAVAVAMRMDHSDYASACAFVCDRAQLLLQRSVESASGLPMDSGVPMIEHAGRMRGALQAHRQAPVESFARQRHAG